VWITSVILLSLYIQKEAPSTIEFTYARACETPAVLPIVKDQMVDRVKDMLRIKRGLAEKITVSARAAGEAYEIDPWLIIAFIKVESDGRTKVISPAGAVGLMQLLPSTGKDIAKSLKEEWRGKEQLFEVDTNIRYGTYYLRELFNRFGTMQAAVAAYNWGPNHIARRIERNAVLPTEYPIKVLAALYTPPSR